MTEPVIEIENVSFAYKVEPVLQEISLTIERGEFIGLVGPNGGGKSTLLKLILGLLHANKGRIKVLGRPPKKGRKKIGYVPQYTTFKREFPITVEDTVLLGLLGKSHTIFGYSNEERELADHAMREAQIENLKHRQLNTLSGGQFQRVLIARALISSPEILILDEPTANIDLRVEENIFDLLKALNQRSTIIVVSHDIGFISEYVNRVACLNKTLICHETSAITGDMIETMYGAPVHMIHHAH